VIVPVVALLRAIVTPVALLLLLLRAFAFPVTAVFPLLRTLLLAAVLAIHPFALAIPLIFPWLRPLALAGAAIFGWPPFAGHIGTAALSALPVAAVLGCIGVPAAVSPSTAIRLLADTVAAPIFGHSGSIALLP